MIYNVELTQLADIVVAVERSTQKKTMASAGA